MAQSQRNEEFQSSNSRPLSTGTFLPNEDPSIGHLDDNNIQITIPSSDHIIPSLSRHEASSSIVAASLQGETDTRVNGHHEKNKKAKQKHGGNAQLLRSTSLPLRTGNPYIVFVDNNNIQDVISSSHHIPSLSRHGHQTPGETHSAAASLHGETDTRLNETPLQVDLGSQKRELYEYAFQGKWEGAKSIYDKYHPDMVRIPLTAGGDTALHVAVKATRTDFVQHLVNHKHMSSEDLQIRNADGNTAFCMAAILGNDDCFKIMTEKNENLPLIRGHDDMLPVHLAAFIGHKSIVQLLISDNHMLEKMAPADLQQLFLLTIDSNMYDVAIELFMKLNRKTKTNLFDKYPIILATARDNQENLTALHLLARKPFDESKYNNNNASLQRLHAKLWFQIRELEYEQILDLVSKPSIVLFDAVKSGNDEVVKQLLYMNPELMLWSKDSTNGQNLLHIAALYRQERIFNYILKMTTANLLKRAVDNDHNNVLHLAASMSQQNEASSSLRPGLHQMHNDLVWFEKASRKLPSILSTMKNKKGQTPKDVFYADHSKLSREFNHAATGIANFGMIVAVLIVAVAFAAAVTVPGDNKTNNWFIVFILANTVAIFTSSASIVSFLSIFTSLRVSDTLYIITMHTYMKLGLTFVFISIAAMVVAFVAASLLIFAHTSEWVGYVVAFLGIIPVTLLVVQFSYSKRLIDYLFWSKYYHPSKIR